ncbi:MAG: T9SS type A sorting domain-containing protein, partial [Ignavibacteria bacterium]
VMRINKLGDTLWTKVYTSSSFASIQKTSDSNYIICSGIGHIFKIDVNGNIIWFKPPYNMSVSTAMIKETLDKGFVLVGVFDAGLTFYPYILKVDSLGNFQWEKTFINICGGAILDIVQTVNKSYATIGDDTISGFILKIDSVGNELWLRHYSNTVGGNSIILLPDSGYVAGGGTYLFRTDKNGNLIWLRFYSINSRNVFNRSTARATDGGYAFTGNTDTMGNFNYFVSLVKTDSLGNTQWYRLFGFNDYDEGFNIRQTSDSGYIIAGIRGNFNGDDIYIIKTDKNGFANPPIGIETISGQIPKGLKLYQNFPNPFNSETKIMLDIARNVYISFRVFDLLGREVYSLSGSKKPGTYAIIFNGSNYPSGMYIYNIESEGISQTKKMLLIK